MIDRNLHDLGGDIADSLESPGDIEPIKAQDDVGGSDGLRSFGRQHRATWRAGVQGVVGRKGGCDFEIGDDARAQAFSEADALVPGILVTGDAAGKDDGVFCAARASSPRLE